MKTANRLGPILLALVAGLSACQRSHKGSAEDTPAASRVDSAETRVEARSASVSPEPGSCPTKAAQRFVGQPDGTALRAALAEVARPHPVRWITPGVAVTQDFRSDRLNVILDDDGRILLLRCG